MIGLGFHACMSLFALWLVLAWPGAVPANPSICAKTENTHGIHALLADPIDMPKLAAYLDGLDNRQRQDQIASLTKDEERRLFEAAKGFRPLTPDYYVTSVTPPLTEITYKGKNTLPVLTHFEKRFCRPDRPTSEPQVWGYNQNPLTRLVGPGYFVAKQAPGGEVVIDYNEIPPAKVKSWPRIKANSEGLQRFIYYQACDYMRGVSKHVSVGHVTMNGEFRDMWFVLCRNEE